MKFYGKVGYAVETETIPGVWTGITERNYSGDVLQVSMRLENNEHGINDNVNISNKISIVADPFAYDNFMSIRYVEWCGKKWKVSDVDIEPPRMIFSIGGLYNDND